MAAVEYALVAPQLLSDVLKRLDNAQPELLALLVLRDGNVFDMADEAKRMDAFEEFAKLARAYGRYMCVENN